MAESGENEGGRWGRGKVGKWERGGGRVEEREGGWGARAGRREEETERCPDSISSMAVIHSSTHKRCHACRGDF